MTPPATAVATAVQSLARPAPRTRIARRSAPAGLTQSASASRTRSTQPEALRLATETPRVRHRLDSATYSLSRITIRVTDGPGMYRWHKRLFVAVARNAVSPVEYFRLPHEGTITMGWQVPL
jgi:K+ transporter